MRVLLGFVLLLHGFAHVVGFLMPWGLAPAAQPGSGRAPDANHLLGGRVYVSDGFARALGLVWLVLAAAFVAVAVGAWRNEAWWLPATLVTVVASLAVSAVHWPAARIGVYIDIALLVLLAAATLGRLPLVGS